MLSIYKSVIESKFTYTFWYIIIYIISAAHIFIHFSYSFIKAEMEIIPTYSIEHKQQKRKTTTLYNRSTGSLVTFRVSTLTFHM